MFGLILKDYYIGKKSFFLMLIILVFYTIFGFSTGNISFVIMFTALFSGMFFMSTMQFDELAKWDGYVLSMPVSRSQVIIARYTASFIIDILGIILLFFIQLIYEKGDVVLAWKNAYLGIIVALVVEFLFEGIGILLATKFGSEKSRFMMMSCIFIPTIVIFILMKANILNESVLNQILDHSDILSIAAIILAFAVFLISMFLSIRIYNKKEF